MSDPIMPEIIYAQGGFSDAYDGVWDGTKNLRGETSPPDRDETPYIRADVAQAMVAAAYEDARRSVTRWFDAFLSGGEGASVGYYEDMLASIQAPDDARAALEAERRKARDG